MLIIDDNDYARAIAETSLSKLGIQQVLDTGDAVSGLDIIANREVDLVLLDWYMPEVSGAGFVRLAKAQGACPPIIVTTAYATKQNFGRIRELGLEHVLVKPFEPTQLHHMIGEALSGSAMPDDETAHAVRL